MGAGDVGVEDLEMVGTVSCRSLQIGALGVAVGVARRRRQRRRAAERSVALAARAQEWLGTSAVNEGVGDNAHHQKRAMEPPSESGGGQS